MSLVFGGLDVFLVLVSEVVQFEVGMVPLCYQQRVLYVPRLKASTAAIS